MASIILLANKTSRNELEQISAAASDMNVADLTVIADSSVDGFDNTSTLIPAEGNDIASNLQEALKVARSENIVVINCSSGATSAIIKQSVNAARALSEQSIELITSDSEDFSSFSAEAILELILHDAKWPVAAVACKKDLLEELVNENLENASELFAKIVIQATISNSTISSRSATLAESPEENFSLSSSAAARSLNLLVNAFAIEELFPQYAWKEHSLESAATSYHTLAALFLRLGDSESAKECLRISDSFEESPRSLALKGLIALNKGETLGAVANLVSSLQQYEERKKSTTHYVKFLPKDLESINSSLASGLEALNQRDNEKALDFFAQAVFNFDEFYAENGIASVKH